MVGAAVLSVLAFAAGCSGDSQPADDPTATVTVTETVTASAVPSQTSTASATPEPSPTLEPSASAESDGCGKPSRSVSAKWETEDVAFPERDVVRTRWSDADITAEFTNNSEHVAVVDGILFFVSKPRGTTPSPRFPMFSIDGDTHSAEVDPGDSFTAPNQPFGLSDWMEQFPLYTKREPRVSVAFDWHYEDADAQARCVDEPARTVPVGKRARVLSNEPWVTNARFTKNALEATVRFCAGDTNEVFDGGKFYTEHPDGTRVEASASNNPIKVPVAAHACRDIRLTFKQVTSRDWTVVHPYGEDEVPLRWTLKRI